MGNESSPPPYEAAAYPAVAAASRRRLRGVFSAKLALVSIVATIFGLVYIGLHRQPRQERQSVVGPQLSAIHLGLFEESVAGCKALYRLPSTPESASRKTNPRWNKQRGQQSRTVLRNATLFDGKTVLVRPMDIVFEKGLIVDVSETSTSWDDGTNLFGRFVTPGVVDMHSHHAFSPWPYVGIQEGNEMHPDTGPLTPFLNIVDSMTAHDAAIRVIMSGGVTSSLIIPGSANIIGGEGVTVKNVEMSGPNGEYVVEEMLLEHGVPHKDRRRYLKMACGENPSRVYGHTRMANAWILRRHMARAKEVMEKQDRYCAAVDDVLAADLVSDADKMRFAREYGSLPAELELESSVGLLRGRVLMQNHCYEPRDFETMLRVSHEFGFRVRAFHHATEAWQVPEMLKEYGDNVTVAIFAEFGSYKQEAYYHDMMAGYRLHLHGVPFAYKSDHGEEMTNAKYLMNQAAVGHNWFVPTDIALQSVTSVPAKALDLDFRIGYARPGFDADLVVWDSHPLGAVATPLQVFVDGVPQLAPEKVKESMGPAFVQDEAAQPPKEPAMRIRVQKQDRDVVCATSRKNRNLVATGIRRVVLGRFSSELQESVDAAGDGPLSLVISHGDVVCLGHERVCETAAAQVLDRDRHATFLNLTDGYLVPGLVAVTDSLGLREIATEPSTGDGTPSPKSLKAEDLPYAKYGVHIEGKAFGLAKLGGITRAVSPPTSGGIMGPGFIVGVSVGIYTDDQRTLLDGAIFKEDVALHLSLGDDAKASEKAVSTAIQELRKALSEGEEDPIWSGNMTVLVHADNPWDMQQLILIKKDFPRFNLVIYGGAGAPHVATELAEAKIPLILTENRPAPDKWWRKDAVVGPPLTRSVASYLLEAGVRFGIGNPSFGDCRLQDLPLEAAWAGRYAGLGLDEALGLVSTQVEDILGLEASEDMVLWEGSPLELSGTPALAVGRRDGKLEVLSCWPGQEEEEEEDHHHHQ